MTIDAIVPYSQESQGIVSGMAIHTTHIAMNPNQREAVLFMQFRYVIHQPGSRGVATRTIITQGHRMYIGVT